MNESSGQIQHEQRAGPFCISEITHAGGLTLASHEHEHACLHAVLGGCYRETTTRGERDSATGSALFKPAGMRHANRFPPAGARTLRIEVDAAADDELARAMTEPGHSDHPAVEILARHLRRELRQRDDLSALALEGHCRDAVVVVLRLQSRSESPAVAERCASLLRERATESALRLGDLAAELHCDRSGLARAFRQRYLCSMGDYVRALRVAHVMRLLEQGDQPLAQAALLGGFADQSHCTRVFRRIVGTTPGSWANVAGNQVGAKRNATGRRRGERREPRPEG